MDGLLLNTEEIYSKVTQQILDNFNVKFTYELKMKMMGLKQQDAAEILIKETG